MHLIKIGDTFVNLDNVSLLGVKKNEKKLGEAEQFVYNIHALVPGGSSPVMLISKATSAEAKQVTNYLLDKCEATFCMELTKKG
jgi:hypothetical protein